MDHSEAKSTIVEFGIFDAKYYVAEYPDVLQGDLDPLDHYMIVGSRLGRLPNPAFSARDLPAAPWNLPLDQLPVIRFITEHGLVFDRSWYLDKYKDIAKAGIDPLVHYRRSGRHEKRSPNRKAELLKNLDAVWYGTKYAEQIAPEETALGHYLSKGAEQGNVPNNKRQLASSFFRRFGLSEYSSHLDFTIEADTVTPLVAGFDLSIAVHMHIFYDSLLEEMSGQVSNITVPYDVFISIPEGTYDPAEITERARGYLKGCRKVTVREFENIGRDIAPMVAGFGPELLAYDLLLHMHSKRSLHNPGQSAWRRYLLHHTCGNENITNQILNAFARDPKMGGCFPPYYGSLRDQPSWGLNLANVKTLGARLGVAPVKDEAVPDFPAGSFFWIRPKAIEPLLNGSMSYDDFDPELGQTDKTTAHAIERLLGHIPEALGYTNAMPFVDVAYDLRHYYPRDRVSPVWTPERIEIDKIVAARAAKPKNRIAMVTAITGGFDPLIIHESLSDDIDYICFSNDPQPDGYGLYDVRPAPYDHPDTRRIARFVKTNLVHLLPDYDTIIWIDGNLQITRPIDGLIARMKSEGLSVAGIPHPIRASYVEEAEVAIKHGLDAEEVIRGQLEKYSADPDLTSEKLIETNFMIFDATDPRVAKVTDTWWSEIETHSKRDQLSINHALKTHGVEWMRIFDDQSSSRDCTFLRMFSHGAGPRYARTDDGCLQVICSHARKGQEIRKLELPVLSDLEALRTASSDARIEVEAVSEASDTRILGDLDALPVSENPEDMALDRLPNGVSLENWVPRRWSQKDWSLPVGLAKLHGASCFGGVITQTFPDGHLKGQLVLANDGALSDASFSVWNGERLLPKDLLTPLGDDSWRLEHGVGPEVLLGDAYLLGSLQPHFGHTLLEGLSRTWALQAYPELFGTMPLLVYEPNLREYQRRFLELAGIDESRIVHVPSGGLTVERLWVPDPAIRSHRWITPLQGAVWQRISNSVSTDQPHRRIYLSRTRISERPLINEDEVEAFLSGLGFEIIHPETLPLDEQIRTAAEAAHIVGPVGSQMYLATFQKPGTRKTILAPSNFYAKDDALISKAIGTDCTVIFGEKIDNFADRADRKWSIDIEKVQARFRDL